MNERKALFEQQAASAAPARTNSGSTPGSNAAAESRAPQVEPASCGDNTKAEGASSLQKTLSLKERMALLQGGGEGGSAASTADTAKQGAPGRIAKPNFAVVQESATTSTAAVAGDSKGAAKAGGLQDRLKAFGGSSVQVPDLQETGRPANVKSASQDHNQEQPQPQPLAKAQSIKDRMTALRGGGAGSDDASGAERRAVGKLRPASSASPPDKAVAQVQNPAAASAQAQANAQTAEKPMSLKDRLALLQQQDKKEEEAKGLQADGTTTQTGESTRGARGQENQQRNTPEKNSAMAQPQAKPAVHARWEVHSLCVPQLELCSCKLREERCNHSCHAV